MQRILIIRFSSIGDIVLTTPVIRVLRTKFPDADIRFVTKPAFASLVEPNPNLNGVFTLNGGIKELAAALKEFQPEAVIDLHHNLRTRILRTLVGGKWYTFDKLNIEKWMRVNLKVDKLPDTHIVDRYLQTVLPLGAENDGRGLDFFFEDGFSAPQVPVDVESGYVVVVIGAKHRTKQLPVEKLVALCNGLQSPIILIGGKEDKTVAKEVEEKSTATIYNACGMTSLAQSAWIVKQAKAVVTHDTGMMHIAAAFNKKIVSVWGNTIPAFGMYPYLPKGEGAYISEVNGLDCRPCSKIGYAECPKGHFKCMNEQNIDKILEQTNQFVA